MAETVRIEGAKKLRKELKKAGFDMAELKPPHTAAAQTVALHARPRTPYRTGALQRTVRSSGTTAGGFIRAGYAGKVLYANPIHWGWPKRNIMAQPWISQAAETTQPLWVEVFMDYMNDTLAQVNGASGL